MLLLLELICYHLQSLSKQDQIVRLGQRSRYQLWYCFVAFKVEAPYWSTQDCLLNNRRLASIPWRDGGPTTTALKVFSGLTSHHPRSALVAAKPFLCPRVVSHISVAMGQRVQDIFASGYTMLGGTDSYICISLDF